MKTANLVITLAGGLLVGLAGTTGTQTTSEIPSSGEQVLAAPIHVSGAFVREVPSRFMHELAVGEQSQPLEVLDLSIEVSARDMQALPPALQPYLHIGERAYPVQRVEYSNWDARDEKPIDTNVPVGSIVTMHFFIENWQHVEEGQLMILSVLSARQISEATGGLYTTDQFNRIMPELEDKQIPRYSPEAFIELTR